MTNLKIVILILIGGYLIASLLLYLLQERFIFLGEPLDNDHRFDFDSPFTEINIDMEDGGRVNALHFTIDNPKGLIVYYHGNAGNLAGWGFVASNFLQFGYDVAIMDYRGYGKSYGKRTQKTLLADAISFYGYFEDQYPEEKIYAYGRSLGTGIAAYVASKKNPGKVILETPYYSFTSLVQAHVPVFPAEPSLKFKFRTHRYLKETSCPIIIFHGTEDSIVPFKQGKRLYESLNDQNVSMVVIEGGEHNNLDSFEEYWVNIEKVLK